MSELLEAVARGALHLVGAVFDLVLELGNLAAGSRHPRRWLGLWLGAVGGVVAWCVVDGVAGWLLLAGAPVALASLGWWADRRVQQRDAVPRPWHEVPPRPPADPDEGNVPRW